MWRSPCMLPSDIELWTCVMPPDTTTSLPNNSVMCARSHGVATLVGGVYDGDQVAMSANPDLISPLESTTDGAHCEGLAQATHFVQGELTHRPATQLQCNREAPLQLYCQYVETLPTPPVRGKACAMAERAQAAALNSPGLNGDGTMLLAFRMAAVDIHRVGRILPFSPKTRNLFRIVYHQTLPSNRHGFFPRGLRLP